MTTSRRLCHSSFKDSDRVVGRLMNLLVREVSESEKSPALMSELLPHRRGRRHGE